MTFKLLTFALQCCTQPYRVTVTHLTKHYDLYVSVSLDHNETLDVFFSVDASLKEMYDSEIIFKQERKNGVKGWMHAKKEQMNE